MSRSTPRPDRPFLSLATLAAWAVVLAAAGSVPRPVEAQDPAQDAGQDPAPGSAQDAALQEELEAMIEETGWNGARWSVLAVSLENGDTLYDRGGLQSLAPASNVKLFTAAAALHYLGPDYRYRTFLLADGPVRDGVLRGDLVLYGTGDPGISDRFQESRTAAFEALADSLLAAGVRRVDGDVVGDGSYFSGPTLVPGWDPRDLNDWFAAPSTGLAFNENVVTLRVEAARTDGAPPTVHTLPPGADLHLDVTARTGGRGRLRIERDAPELPIRIEGGIARGGRDVWRQMTVTDPAHFTASVLRHVLTERGIEVGGGARGVTEPGASALTGRLVFAATGEEDDQGDETRPPPRVLATHVSPPLQEYLEVVNKKSHNLLAELALKTVGRVRAGDGSFGGGAAAIREFLAGSVGVDTSRVRIVDGSGLSAENRASAADFIQLMGYMAGSPLWDAFWATLPEAGNSRELRRMYRTEAAGNLRAKTGTIQDVSALSGVLRSAAGERIAFSILVNDVPSTWGAKRIEDRIGTRLATLERPWQARDVRFAAAPATGQEEEGAAEAADRPVRTAAADDEAGEASGAASAASHEGPAGPGTRSASTAPPGRRPDQGPEAGEDARVATRDADPAAPSDRPDPDTAAADGPAPEPRVHVVRSGENLTVIARRNDVTLNALIEANPDVDARRLQPGMRLRVPASPQGAAPAERTDPDRHRVAAGENFTVIARRYGVSLNELMDANPGISPRQLQAGQWLQIPPAPSRR